MKIESYIQIFFSYKIPYFRSGLQTCIRIKKERFLICLQHCLVKWPTEAEERSRGYFIDTKQKTDV